MKNTEGQADRARSNSMEANEKVGQCLVCGFAVLPGQGRIAGKSIVHAQMETCNELKAREADRQAKALRRKVLIRRLVARAAK